MIFWGKSLPCRLLGGGTSLSWCFSIITALFHSLLQCLSSHTQTHKGCHGDLHAVLWWLPWHQCLLGAECFVGTVVALPPPAAQINKNVVIFFVCLDVYCLMKWIIMTDIEKYEDVGETDSDRGVFSRDDLWTDDWKQPWSGCDCRAERPGWIEEREAVMCCLFQLQIGRKIQRIYSVMLFLP